MRREFIRNAQTSTTRQAAHAPWRMVALSCRGLARLALGFQDRPSPGQRRFCTVHEASRPRLSTASPPSDACASILVLAHYPGAALAIRDISWTFPRSTSAFGLAPPH